MKLFLVFVMTMVMSVAHAVITKPASNSYDATGTIRDTDEVDTKVKCNGTHAAGVLVKVNTTDDDGASVSAATSLGGPAHCVLTESCTDGKMAKCRVWGKVSASYSATGDNGAVGGYVFASSDALGYVTGIDSDSEFATAKYPIGVFLDAVSATGSVEIFIRNM